MSCPSRLIPFSGRLLRESPISSPYVCVRCARRPVPDRLTSASSRRCYNRAARPAGAPIQRQRQPKTREAHSTSTTSLPASTVKEPGRGDESRVEEQIRKPRYREPSPQNTYAGGERGGIINARDWEGLPRVGGTAGWAERWDEMYQFTGFMPRQKVDAPEQKREALRRALVEVYALGSADRPLADALKLPLVNQCDYSAVRICVEEDGSVSLESGSSPEEIVNLLSTEMPVGEEEEGNRELALAQEEVIRRSLAEDAVASNGEDHTWMQIPLEDLELKFVVLRRITQLTGTVIPDPLIAGFETAADVYSFFIEKPKPEKLMQTLTTKEQLTDLPNVRLFDRRHVVADKEKEVGRWKVITKELEKRDIPVDGRRLRHSARSFFY